MMKSTIKHMAFTKNTPITASINYAIKIKQPKVKSDIVNENSVYSIDIITIHDIKCIE